MKAQFVYENINFERNQDPKKTMKMGRWIEKDIENGLKSLVSKHDGSYTIKWIPEESAIEGFYKNNLFNSKGRFIKYNLNSNKFYMSFPGMGSYMEIPKLRTFLDEVDTDLTWRKEEGYTPLDDSKFLETIE